MRALLFSEGATALPFQVDVLRSCGLVRRTRWIVPAVFFAIVMSYCFSFDVLAETEIQNSELRVSVSALDGTYQITRKGSESPARAVILFDHSHFS